MKWRSVARGAALATLTASFVIPATVSALPQTPETVHTVPAEEPQEETRPMNVIVIMTDDQDRRSLYVDENGNSNMPYLLGWPDGGWHQFERGYVNSTICTPSRASLLTGLYTGNNYGITHNGSANRAVFWETRDTVPNYLRAAGVTTIKIGKNMNGVRKAYPIRGGSWDDEGGWDYYSNKYANTLGLFDEAADAFENALAAGQPIYMELTPVAGKYAVKPSRQSDPNLVVLPPRTPDIGEEDISDKPEIYHDLLDLYSNQQLNRKVRSFDGKRRLRAYQTLQDADAGLQNLMDRLEALGELDNTIIIWTSDHGFGYGSHSIERKDVPYEEIVGVPMLMRVPGTENQQRLEIVSTMDVVAGVLSHFGATATVPVDGDDMSLLWDGDPSNDVSWDNTILFQRRANPRDGRRGFNSRPDGYVYDGVVTTLNGQTWKYIVYEDGQTEMYDLENDPYELDNVSGNVGFADVEAELLAIVEQELAE